MKTLITACIAFTLASSALAADPTITDQDIISALEKHPVAAAGFAHARAQVGDACSYTVSQNQSDYTYSLNYTCIAPGDYEDGGETASIITVEGNAWSKTGITVDVLRIGFAG